MAVDNVQIMWDGAANSPTCTLLTEHVIVIVIKNEQQQTDFCVIHLWIHRFNHLMPTIRWYDPVLTSIDDQYIECFA
jgi:hypothetical protein